MALRGFQAILTACISLMVLIIVCFMFVDDDQIQITATNSRDPAESVLPRSQQALDYWVGYLGSTGGAINPEKSYWYMLDWHWSRNQWTPRLSSDMEGSLTAVNPSGDRKPLTRLEPSQASVQLGIHSAPDGNQKAQFDYLLGKAQDFAANLRKQRLLNKNEVWTNLTLSINRTLEYPMITTRLTCPNGKGSPQSSIKLPFQELVLSAP